MQKRYWRGETEADSKSGEEKSEKGGEEMTREEVVQAALTVERWCKKHIAEDGNCDCPFVGSDVLCMVTAPCGWYLEKRLRTRGLKHD